MSWIDVVALIAIALGIAGYMIRILFGFPVEIIHDPLDDKNQNQD